MLSLTDILGGSGETLVPLNHIQQQITFILGTGVDFLPLVDMENRRKGLIDQVGDQSRLELHLPQWAAWLMEKGRLLLYLRSDGRLYQIHGYCKDDYRIEQSPDGRLQMATFRYAYTRREETGMQRQMWVQVRITDTVIEKREGETCPNLDQPFVPDSIPQPNLFGFVPCVEVLNPPPTGGKPGEGDFDRLAGAIECHDDLVGNIVDNLYYFSESPLVTTREAGEVTEAIAGSTEALDRDSVAYASGFRGSERRPNRKRERRHRLKRVIGGVEPDELFQQLNINPVPQDHILFADQYERQLRESLGGILERGIETATESRVVFGKVAATAKRKQQALFKYGLCQIFEMAILAEEALFLASRGAFGLPYLGERMVGYRVGAVYQPTTRDTLDRSIVSRNLMRQGVNAKEALKFVFPEKSEAEIAQMVGSGGLPSEFLRDTMGLLAQLQQMFDPITGLPLQDPATGVPLVQALLPFITNALSYGQQFYPGSSGQSVSPARAAAESGALSTAPERIARIVRNAISADRGGLVSANNRQSVDGVDGQQPPIPGSVQSGATTSIPGSSPNPFANFLNFERSPILNFFRR
jgi:hypothetical protein